MRTFSLRFLILLVVIIGLICGWAVDRHRLQRNLDIERNRSFVSAEDYDTRVKKISMLANKEDPDVPLLLFAMSDPSPVVQKTALDALQKIATDERFGPHEKEVISELERWLLREKKKS